MNLPNSVEEYYQLEMALSNSPRTLTFLQLLRKNNIISISQDIGPALDIIDDWLVLNVAWLRPIIEFTEHTYRSTGCIFVDVKIMGYTHRLSNPARYRRLTEYYALLSE